MPARRERLPTLRRWRRGRRAKKPIASFSDLCINSGAFQSETPGRSAFLRKVCASDLASGRLRPKAEFILLEKRARRLTLWHDGFAVREFRVALGGDPVGHKRRQGDGKTPEGRYWIAGRNQKSRFHRSLKISYPSVTDEYLAKRAGVDDVGGEIMIHGLPAGAGWIGKHHAGLDWTRGCIAVTNEEIDEIWELVVEGTPIEIRP